MEQNKNTSNQDTWIEELEKELIKLGAKKGHATGSLVISLPKRKKK